MEIKGFKSKIYLKAEWEPVYWRIAIGVLNVFYW